VVTDQELMLKERMMRLENQDKKEDQQRYMVWFSAISVTLFIVVLMLPVVPLDRVDHLSSIASTWVISNMGIIGAFIAGNAFSRKSGGGKNEPI
jgi:preprotein translocase subunit SecY